MALCTVMTRGGGGGIFSIFFLLRVEPNDKGPMGAYFRPHITYVESNCRASCFSGAEWSRQIKPTTLPEHCTCLGPAHCVKTDIPTRACMLSSYCILNH
jgi:hypothetical protein